MIHERAITLLSGRCGGRAAPQAYLEFAQEHFLAWMAAESLFDLPRAHRTLAEHRLDVQSPH